MDTRTRVDAQERRKDTKMIVRYYELFSRCVTVEEFKRIQLDEMDDGIWGIIANKPKFAYSPQCIDYDREYPCLLYIETQKDADKVMQYIGDRLSSGKKYIDLLPFDTLYQRLQDCKPTDEQ